MKTLARISIVIVVVAVLSVLLSLALISSQPAPAQAQSTGSWATYVLRSGTTSITADANTSGFNVVDYGRADCYQTVDITSATNVTTTLQHSSDNSNWVDGATLTVQTADGTVQYTTGITGSYLRASIDVMNSNPVTPTIRCILKDVNN